MDLGKLAVQDEVGDNAVIVIACLPNGTLAKKRWQHDIKVLGANAKFSLGIFGR